MNEHDDLIERVAETLKAPVEIDRGLDARVMAEIATISGPKTSPSAARRIFEWFIEPRTIRMNPIGGLAVAAGVVAMIFVGSRVLAPGADQRAVGTGIQIETTTVQFVLVAPDAETVAVVGDFNDWDVSATMLSQDRAPGVWSITVPLEPGRYRYSFLVDGTNWLTDPRAALAVADEFGRPNSVLTIGDL